VRRSVQKAVDFKKVSKKTDKTGETLRIILVLQRLGHEAGRDHAVSSRSKNQKGSPRPRGKPWAEACGRRKI